MLYNFSLGFSCCLELRKRSADVDLLVSEQSVSHRRAKLLAFGLAKIYMVKKCVSVITNPAQAELTRQEKREVDRQFPDCPANDQILGNCVLCYNSSTS